MDSRYINPGYAQLPGFDYSLEPGSRKIVVHATKHTDGSIKEITHVSLQDGYGTWESDDSPA